MIIAGIVAVIVLYFIIITWDHDEYKRMQERSYRDAWKNGPKHTYGGV
jgi:hypothetical protein